jgi:hypothetical protein
VLPPWGQLYHWQSTDVGRQDMLPWSLFFDVPSLQQFAPVIEMNDFLQGMATVYTGRSYLFHFEAGSIVSSIYSHPQKCFCLEIIWKINTLKMFCITYQKCVLQYKQNTKLTKFWLKSTMVRACRGPGRRFVDNSKMDV